MSCVRHDGRHDRTLATGSARTRREDPHPAGVEPRGDRGPSRPHRRGQPASQRRSSAVRRRGTRRLPMPPIGPSPTATTARHLPWGAVTVKENIDLAGTPTTQGVAGARRRRRADRRTDGRADAGRRRDPVRPHEPARSRPAGPHRLDLARSHPQPASPGTHRRRVERWRGVGDRVGHEPARTRQRHRRIAPQPGALLWSVLDQADRRRRADGHRDPARELHARGAADAGARARWHATWSMCAPGSSRSPV